MLRIAAKWLSDHIVDASEMEAGCGLACLPKRHLGYEICFAKTRCLTIKDLKDK